SMGGGGALTFAAHHPDRVRGVCDIFGVTDFTQFYNSKRYQESLSKAFGGTPETAPEVFKAQSAMTSIAAFAKIPVFVLHGDQDTVVPTEHSRQFVKALMAPGYDVVYREVKGGKHQSELISGHEEEILAFFDAVGGEAYDPRLAFAAGRRNLALGRPYQYSAEPLYRLTEDAGDLTDLTDGALSKRRDERIWFESHCVAWYGEPGANIVIDLGTVEGIGEITGRFLGGREQSGLRFPRRVQVAVSADGAEYRDVGLYRKGPDDAAFGVPAEEGKAWVHALRFKDLRARGRFVAFLLEFDGSFCAADELFVLGSDHPSSQDRLGARVERPVVFPFGPNRYTAYPLKGEWFAGELETWTCIGGANTLADKAKPVTLILDLPREVILTKTMLNERYGGQPAPAPSPREVAADGVAYHRYEIETRGLSEKFWLYLFWKTRQPDGWTGRARLGSRWTGGEQEMVAVTFRAVHIPKAPRPKSLHVSLDWMGQGFWTRNTATVLDILDHCGFTAVPYFGMFLKPPDTALRDALTAAEKRGLEVVFNFSPIHALAAKKASNPEVLCALPGGRKGHLCPSFRGPLLTEHLDAIAAAFAFHPARWVFLDCEVHWSSPDEMTQCERCKAQMRAGESGEVLAGRMGRELFGMLRARLEAARRAQNGPAFRMGSYAISPAQTRYPVLRFKDLHPDILDFAMPSIYTVQPGAVQRRVAEDRALLDRDAVIPWLQPGTMGEKPATAVFQEALGCFLAGGEGLAYYTHHGFDAADFAAVARALILAGRCETLLAKGRMISEWTGARDGLALCGKRLGGQALWLVASELSEPLRTALPRPQGLPGAPNELSFDRGNLILTPVRQDEFALNPHDVRVFVSD
ncbi:MAG: hypothetical protein FJ279_08510, partial [Planctomycetes bacterium]|nr:hypothetical protein [Planctomycetota bacterium]